MSLHIRFKSKFLTTNITLKLFFLRIIEKAKVDPAPVFDQHILETKLFTANITFKYFLILRGGKVFLQTMISSKLGDINLDVVWGRHHFPLRIL